MGCHLHKNPLKKTRPHATQRRAKPKLFIGDHRTICQVLAFVDQRDIVKKAAPCGREGKGGRVVVFVREGAALVGGEMARLLKRDLEGVTKGQFGVGNACSG